MEYFASIFGPYANWLEHYPFRDFAFEFVYYWTDSSAPFALCM